MPASRIFRISESGMGSGFSRRIARVECMISKSSFVSAMLGPPGRELTPGVLTARVVFGVWRVSDFSLLTGFSVRIAALWAVDDQRAFSGAQRRWDVCGSASLENRDRATIAAPGGIPSPRKSRCRVGARTKETPMSDATHELNRALQPTTDVDRVGLERLGDEIAEL